MLNSEDNARKDYHKTAALGIKLFKKTEYK